MKTWPLRLGGLLIVLMGLVWIGQGFNLIPGSFMTGRIEWAWRGAAMALFGAGLLYWSGRPR